MTVFRYGSTVQRPYSQSLDDLVPIRNGTFLDTFLRDRADEQIGAVRGLMRLNNVYGSYTVTQYHTENEDETTRRRLVQMNGNSRQDLIFMNHIHAFVEITMSLIQQWALILYFHGPLVRPHQIPFLPTYQQQTSSTNSLAQQAQTNSMMSWAVGYSISPRLPPIHSDVTNVQMRVNGQPGWREGPIIGTRQMLPFIMECFQVLLRILIAGDFFQPWTVR